MKTITVFHKSQEILSVFKALFAVEDGQWQALQSHSVFGYLCYYISAVQSPTMAKEVIEMYCDVQAEINQDITTASIKSFIQNAFYSAKVIAESEKDATSLREIVGHHVAAMIASNIWESDNNKKTTAEEEMMRFIEFLSENDAMQYQTKRTAVTSATDTASTEDHIKVGKPAAQTLSANVVESEIAHSTNPGKKKKGLIIGICSVLFLALATGAILFFINGGLSNNSDKYEAIDMAQYEHMLSDTDLRYVGLWIAEYVIKNGERYNADDTGLDWRVTLKSDGLFTIKEDGNVLFQGDWNSTDRDVQLKDVYDNTVYTAKWDTVTLQVDMGEEGVFHCTSPGLSQSGYIGEWKVEKTENGVNVDTDGEQWVLREFPDDMIAQICSNGTFVIYRGDKEMVSCFWQEEGNTISFFTFDNNGQNAYYESEVNGNEIIIQIGSKKYYVKRD